MKDSWPKMPGLISISLSVQEDRVEKVLMRIFDRIEDSRGSILVSTPVEKR